MTRDVSIDNKEQIMDELRQVIKRALKAGIRPVEITSEIPRIITDEKLSILFHNLVDELPKDKGPVTIVTL